MKHRGRAWDCRPTAAQIKNRKSKIENSLWPGSRPGLVVNRSTTRRVAPTRLQVAPVLYDARHGRVAARVVEHLLTSRAVVLRVVLRKRDALRVVMVARL